MTRDIETEVDAIRDKIYKTTQKMTSQERIEYVNSRARKILESHQKSNHATDRNTLTTKH